MDVPANNALHHSDDMPAPQSRVRRVRTLILAAAGAALGWLALSPASARLVWNYTESVPVGLYWIDHIPPQRGDTIVLAPLKRTADELERASVLRAGHLIVKPLAGIAGDRVCREGRDVTIDGKVVARARTYTSSGSTLPSWSGCHTLGRDELFLIAGHPASFDSRYLGPVTAQRVFGVARPIFTLPSTWETR